MAKYRLLRDRVVREMPTVQMVQAPTATDGELALAHTPAYIEAIALGTLPAPAQREIGFPWSLAMAAPSTTSLNQHLTVVLASLSLIAVSVFWIEVVWMIFLGYVVVTAVIHVINHIRWGNAVRQIIS